jgi:uncharacterized protein (DUF924 family)
VTEHADRAASETIDPASVLAFWRSAGPDKWFANDAAFDSEVSDCFLELWHAGCMPGPSGLACR